MALFGKKKSEGPTIDPEIERRNQAWAKLDQHIDTNAIFQLQTFDHLNWIDPFSGTIVPAPFGHAEIARKYYAEHEHWMKGQTKPSAELHAIRWQHWIRLNIKADDRLRIFDGQGRWMNPHNGEFAHQARREGTKVTAATLLAMGRSLVESGARQPDDLLAMDELQRRIGLPGSNADDSGVVPIIGDGDFNAGSGDGVALESTESFRAPAQGGGRRISSDRFKAVNSANEANIKGLRSIFEKIGTDQDKQTSEDLERARKVQENMLPTLPDIPGYEIAVRYDPYDAIGGDLYEIAQLDEQRFLILVGDVTGHGVQAALVTSSMIKALRFITRQEQDLVEILCALNDNAKEDLISGQFVTVWAGILDTAGHRIEAVCAGHHQALLGNSKRNAPIERISNKGIAIGLTNSGTLRKQLKTEVYQIQPGDTLVQYTDGLNEMMNADKVEYGELRVIGSMVSYLDQPLTDMLTGMVDMARIFAGSDPDDDVTLLALRLAHPDDEAES